MRRLAAWLLVVNGCGGRADTHVPSLEEAPAGSAGWPSEADDGAAGTTAGAAAGEPLAGAGGAAEPSLIDSATRYCEDSRFCFGLSCYAPSGTAGAVCVRGCERDRDCEKGYLCLQSDELHAGCYRQCDSPFDCAYGFDCFDFSGQQQALVCFPQAWAAVWERR